jgi:GNAT superfamily N-acetyltransferase
MDIVTGDRSDDGLLCRLHAIRDRSDALSRAVPPRVPVDEFVQGVRSDLPGEVQALGVALDGGTPVGYARVYVFRRENLDKCWTEVVVDPDHRGHGAGSRLLAWAEQVARANDRAMVLGEVFVPARDRGEHPARRWAAKRGYAPISTDIIRMLRLPTPRGRLEGLAREAGHAHGDYDIRVYGWGVPEELRPGVCDAGNRLMVDAPTGDVEFEPGSLTPEDYAELIDLHRRSGTLPLTAVAVHRASGEVAAYTDLHLPAGNPRVAHQMGTLVVPEHRGHRLGMAVKAANLLEVERSYPERELVLTQNAEDNPHMVAINVSLGFEVVEHCLPLRRVLTSDG